MALPVSGAAFAIYWITVRVGLRAAGPGTREAAAMPGLWRELVQQAGVASARLVEVAAVTDARRRGVSWTS